MVIRQKPFPKIAVLRTVLSDFDGAVDDIARVAYGGPEREPVPWRHHERSCCRPSHMNMVPAVSLLSS